MLYTGIAAHYFSWRLLQLGLGLTGLIVFLVAILFFPETYHPGQRGVDKVDPASIPTWRPVLLNPFQPLWILRSPNLLAVVGRIPMDKLHLIIWTATRRWQGLPHF